jgi:hypothetical protein
MKHYQDGGMIPQEALDIMQDEKERKGRERFEQMQRAENEAPKKAVIGVMDRFRGMMGMGSKKSDKKSKEGKVKMASGGYVRKADGCAVKGKTKGKFV